jgi:hypothetical protein
MPMTEAAIDTGLHARPVRVAGRAAGRQDLDVRVYHKPFVDWIWGGCLLMALGGLLAATDRRYRVPVKAAIRRHWRRPVRGLHQTAATARREPRQSAAAMKSQKFLIPLGLFAGAGGVPGRGPDAQAARGAVALHRQAGAGLQLPQLHDPSHASSRQDAGQGLDAQRLGVVVRGPAAKNTRCWWSWRAQAGAHLGLNYKDDPRNRHEWLQRWATRTRRRCRPRRPLGIDFGVYGVPETFVIDREGVIRYKHIGPLTPEVLEATCCRWSKAARVRAMMRDVGSLVAPLRPGPQGRAWPCCAGALAGAARPGVAEAAPWPKTRRWKSA